MVKKSVLISFDCSESLGYTLAMRFLLGLGVAAGMAVCVVSAQTTATAPAAKHGMVLDDLAKIVRVGAPKLSPDGAWILYTVSKTDVGEDKSSSSLWMVSWDGKQDVQLTFGKDGAGARARPRAARCGCWTVAGARRSSSPM
jgi:hypothetical protein